MSIPRKKSRPIEVDGHKFRWMVRSEGSPGRDWHTVLTLQEDVEQPGAVLQLKLYCKETVGWDHDENEARAPDVSVTPADVTDVVRTALRSGWDPSTKGSAKSVEVSLPRWSTRPDDFSIVER